MIETHDASHSWLTLLHPLFHTSKENRHAQPCARQSQPGYPGDEEAQRHRQRRRPPHRPRQRREGHPGQRHRDPRRRPPCPRNHLGLTWARPRRSPKAPRIPPTGGLPLEGSPPNPTPFNQKGVFFYLRARVLDGLLLCASISARSAWVDFVSAIPPSRNGSFPRRSTDAAAQPWQPHPDRQHEVGPRHQRRRPAGPAVAGRDPPERQGHHLPRRDLRRPEGQLRRLPQERQVDRHRAEQPVRGRPGDAAGRFPGPGPQLPGEPGLHHHRPVRHQVLIRRRPPLET